MTGRYISAVIVPTRAKEQVFRTTWSRAPQSFAFGANALRRATYESSRSREARERSAQPVAVDQIAGAEAVARQGGNSGLC